MLLPDPKSISNVFGPRERLTIGLVFLGLAAMYLRNPRVIDPDVWHQMALIREGLTIGHLPKIDPFAYTPTIEPMVQHEWGMGVILLAVFNTSGAVGLSMLSHALALGIALGCVLCARQRGVSYPVLFATLPVAILFVGVGLTVVRAQMFTLLFLAWLLWFIELDRDGRRWWIAPWLVMYLLWANLHAGFVVGVIAFGAYTFEQMVLRRPVRRLFAVGFLMTLLPLVNPYGPDYYLYLLHALRMERPLIAEWQPLVSALSPIVVIFLFSLLLAIYGLYRSGWRQIVGMLFFFAAVYATFKHARHLSIYAVAWVCFVPPLLQNTPIGSMLSRAFNPRRPAVTIAAAAAAVLLTAGYIYNQPWYARMPGKPGDEATLFYPYGAVEYLRDQGFRGNLLTPFSAGAYVSWYLYPNVLVSLDGRYEVAYPPTLLQDHADFFAASDRWEAFLGAHPTDAVLVRPSMPVAERLAELPNWNLVHSDEAFEIYAREGLLPPLLDRSEPMAHPAIRSEVGPPRN